MKGIGRGAALAVSAAGLLFGLTASAGAETKVVVTIKPLHALVAQVMGDTGTPELLVQGTNSAHTYALKPSDAAKLNQADVLFRMSDIMEPFTAKLAKSLPKRVQIVTLQDSRALKLLKRRTGATFEDEHDHDDHGHDHGDGHSHGHSHGAIDGHAWLDPANAKLMAARIAQVLGAKDAAQAKVYRANADALAAKLDALDAELKRDLAPVAGKPFVVFHDALQYFERRYGLKAVGSIAISPEVPPSAKRLSTLRKRVASLGAVCVFAEPQFDTRLADNVVEGTKARIGTVDPEGAKIEAGPDLYFALLRNLAKDLKACLG
jgi:zinc transport system substrate-binding protein